MSWLSLSLLLSCSLSLAHSPLLTLPCSCLLSPFSASITVCLPSRVHTVRGSLGHHLFILVFMSFGSYSLYLALSLPIPWPLLLTHPPHLPSFHPICPLPRVCWVIGYISGFSLQGMQIFKYFPLLYLLTTILHCAPSPPTSSFTSLLPLLLPLSPTLYCPLLPSPLLHNPLLLPTIHVTSLSFALLHADTLDCLLPSIPSPSIRAAVLITIQSRIYDLILSPHVLYNIHLLL